MLLPFQAGISLGAVSGIVERKQRWLEEENEKLAYLKDEIEKLGFTRVPGSWSVDTKLREVTEKLPTDFVRNLRSLKDSLDKAICQLDCVQVDGA
jgi:hypothetical protein